MIAKTDLSEMAEGWPSRFVAREEIGTFTGGILKPKTIANYDSVGKGISPRYKIGHKTVYRVSDIISWLEGRAQKVGT